MKCVVLLLCSLALAACYIPSMKKRVTKEDQVISLLTEIKDRLKKREEEEQSAVRVSPTTPSTPPPITPPPARPLPVDCEAVYRSGQRAASRYSLQGPTGPVNAWCDGGWTYIQRRTSGMLRFNRNLVDYAKGFGVVSDEHWLGLDTLNWLSRDYYYTLQADFYIDDRHQNPAMQIVRIDRFSVDSAPLYTLSVADVSTSLGRAGNTVVDYLQNKAHGINFSTFDHDRDNRLKQSCSKMYRGGWWFHSYCAAFQPNGNHQRWDHANCSANNKVCAWVQPYAVRSIELKIRRAK